MTGTRSASGAAARRDVRRAPRTAGNRLAIAAAAIAAVGALAAGGALAQAPSPTKGSAKLPAEIRVGITPNYPPLAFKRDGQLVGIEPDLAKELANQLGVRFVLVETPWDELLDALEGREVDVIMSGVSVTERRKKRVHFTQSYLETGQMALIRKDDLTKLSPPDAMNQKGVKVGVERLTTGAKYAREKLESATIVEYDSIDAGLEALRGKQIDYFIHDAPTVWRVSGHFDAADDQLTGLYRPLTHEEIAWAVRKDDASTLGAALDGALDKLRTNGSLAKVLDRWITVRKVTKEIAPAS